mmetsp:Transcript_102674/g.306651  ORF Transcript_102674/g.306651 Transcript_102674/m.306651 type:complete len:316 (+) Transcript_102674:1689-2636(+)
MCSQAASAVAAPVWPGPRRRRTASPWGHSGAAARGDSPSAVAARRTGGRGAGPSPSKSTLPGTSGSVQHLSCGEGERWLLPMPGRGGGSESSRVISSGISSGSETCLASLDAVASGGSDICLDHPRAYTVAGSDIWRDHGLVRPQPALTPGQSCGSAGASLKACSRQIRTAMQEPAKVSPLVSPAPAPGACCRRLDVSSSTRRVSLCAQKSSRSGFDAWTTTLRRVLCVSIRWYLTGLHRSARSGLSRLRTFAISSESVPQVASRGTQSQSSRGTSNERSRIMRACDSLLDGEEGVAPCAALLPPCSHVRTGTPW